ncbi:hypothetical protein C7999DRAFT_44591 [Corynascus novoguineensis]|uniref:Major facilitator superfamily transporter n=1 Tax=Corynascus novoguineensis TaxID=1126955 RepID=A0AAN7HBF6_9PEZI|nr:hypothetical protein C7999DRAFT_44591 [Corynascus novoguineensis]
MPDDNNSFAAGDAAEDILPHQRSAPAAPRRAIRPLLLLVALVNLAWSLYQLPVSRVLESRLCREHYAAHDPSILQPDESIPEKLCKIDPVQQPLGRIQGMTEAAWVAGDFFMTIPLVCLADYLGHRFVLWLNLAPRVLLLAWTFAVGYFDRVLPVEAILAAPVFSFLGGDCVFNSIIYALVSDLTVDHVLRATFFGYVNAVSSIFSLQLGPALASASMSALLWLPLWIGIAILLLSIPVISALPLPSRTRTSSPTTADDEEEQANPHTPFLSRRHSPSPLRQPPTTMATATTLRSLTAARLRALIGLLVNRTRNLGLLLSVFFLASLASSDTKLLPLYISNRYAWTFASVGYLLSAKALFNFFLLWVAVPRALRWQQRRRSQLRGQQQQQQQRQEWGSGSGDSSSSSSSSSNNNNSRSALGVSPPVQDDDGDNDGKKTSGADGAADWWDVRRNAEVCLWFSVLGALCISGAGSVWLLVPALGVYALGIALPMFTYSLLRAPGMGLAEEGGNKNSGGDGPGARVFSVVMLVRTLGSLVGAVVMPGLWVKGLGMGVLQLPYVASALFYLVAAVVVRMIEV